MKLTIDLSDPDSIPATLDAHSASPQVFLAYSHADREMVDRIAADLRDMGLRIWYDRVEVHPGDNIEQKLKEGVASSGYMLAVLSEASVSSRWATREMEMGLRRETEGRWPRLIPVLLGDVHPPAFLAQKSYVDLREDYEDGLAKVVRAIQRGRSSGLPGTTPTVADTGS